MLQLRCKFSTSDCYLEIFVNNVAWKKHIGSMKNMNKIEN